VTSSPTKTSPFALNREGVWQERISQNDDLHEIVLRRPLPIQLIRDYAAAAVRHAKVREEDEEWFAEIEGFPGVWSRASSVKQAIDELEEVVFDWVLLKIQDEDRDLPVVESIDLNTI
jgi:predicted RNase H-like HicB family nuclease